MATIATARQQLVKVETTVLFMVEYAGVETFRIQVPELPGVDGADAQEVQITSIHLPGVRSASGRRQTAALAIREKTAGEAEDGWVIWTITMQREVTGPQAFRVTWDVKPPGEDEKATALRKVLVQPPRPLDLDNENIVGEILVVKDRSLEVTTSDPDKDQQVLEVIERVGPSDANVLIVGEHGTGKEVVAQWLHAVSKRSKNTLLAVNVGGFSEGVFDSELFGHVKGAFTGATFPPNSFW